MIEGEENTNEIIVYIVMNIFSYGYNLLKEETRKSLAQEKINFYTENFSSEEIFKILIISKTIFRLIEHEDDRIKNIMNITFVEAGISVKMYTEMDSLGIGAKQQFFDWLDNFFKKGCKDNIPALEARLGFWGIIEHTLFARPAGIGSFKKEHTLHIIDIFLKSILKQTVITIDKLQEIDASKEDVDSTITFLQKLSKHMED